MSADGARPVTPSGGAKERRFEVITVYAIGLFQGLSLVAFPAAATILQSPTGYDLSKSRYGLLFLPQVIMAIAGSLAMPTLVAPFPSQAGADGRRGGRHGGHGLAGGQRPGPHRGHRLSHAPGGHGLPSASASGSP